MPGVPRELAEHTLNIDPKFKPVKQFLRRFNEERCKAIGEEVARLLVDVHAYVDDIVVKSREKETLIDDLKETFDNLRVYKMMLNPAKCVFGVPAGKLLGFLVSNRGIEANPEKIKAITSLAKSVCINNV